MTLKKNNTVLELNNISKHFWQSKKKLEIIKNSFLSIKEGEIISLIGPSGSGKTTLLQITGLLDTPTSGEVIINSKSYKNNTKDSVRTSARKNEIGFVYQFHHLLPEFSALENVMLPLLIKGYNKKQSKEISENILSEVKLQDRLSHRPSALSGGEQQRVAIARAIVGKPSIILADEPTGNLDPKTSEAVFDLLLGTIKKHNLSSLIVTHEHNLAKRMDRIVTIKEGFLQNEKL
ncbi:ABC transporter ATP-binding protein [Pseudomonadota bacterium]